MTPKQRTNLFRALVLILVVASSIYIFSIGDRVRQLAGYGYPGIFFFSILANATVILPAPGILFVFVLGAVFNPMGVALAAGAGAAIGELSGYLAGFGGQAVIERVDIYERIRSWMDSHQQISYLAILVLAFVPNPIFDLAGIAAGTLKMPVTRFLFWCWLGKTLKMIVIAYAGSQGLGWFSRFL
jgi:membrane protein YqaA with SNARE-associated domain